MAKRILSIGQCAADHAGIRWFLTSSIDGLDVDAAASEADATVALAARRYDLVLVNRLLDRDRSSGIDLIRRMKGDGRLSDVPAMLVSNLADAQNRAVEAGALAGFGKADLDDAALARVVAAIGSERP